MLKGTLDDFTLPDIFRFLASGRKTGCVEVTGSARDGRVFLREGDVYYGESSRTRGLDRDPSPTAIKTQIEDSFFDLLRWSMTEFTYSSGVEVEPGAAVEMNVEELLTETSRKLEELEVISTKIPNEHAVMVMAPTPPAEGAINITPEQWRVLVLVTGTRSVVDIADSVGQDSFSVMRTLYGLATTGLIEVVPALEPALEAEPEAEPEAESEAPDAGADTYIEALSAPLEGPELAEQMEAEFPPFDPGEPDSEAHSDVDPGPPEEDGLPLAVADDTEAAAGSDLDEDAGGAAPSLEGSGLADLEGAEGVVDTEDIPVEESSGSTVVDRLAAVKELADLFERTDDHSAGPPYPAELAAQRAAAGDTNGDGRRRVEDDEEITRGLISRLIDGVKGL